MRTDVESNWGTIEISRLVKIAVKLLLKAPICVMNGHHVQMFNYISKKKEI